MASPESRQFLEVLQARPRPGAPVPFEQMRSAFATAMTALPLPPGTTTERATVGGVPCELLSFPAADASNLVLYFHGGGNVVGSLDSHREIACRVGVSAGCPVLNVGFRVGPEDPFPAAVEDAVAVYVSVLASGRAPASVAVVGDSAGGGLGVALLLSARDSAMRMPSCAVMISACLDLSLSGSSITRGEIADPTFNLVSTRRLFDAYLGGADAKTPFASPLFGDLRGLPSLLIQCGSLEAFLEEARAFHAAAKRAGVESTMEEYEGQVHDFQALAPTLPETLDALQTIGSFLRAKMSMQA